MNCCSPPWVSDSVDLEWDLRTWICKKTLYHCWSKDHAWRTSAVVCQILYLHVLAAFWLRNLPYCIRIHLNNTPCGPWIPSYYMIPHILSSFLVGVIRNTVFNTSGTLNNKMLPVTLTFQVVCLNGKSMHLDIWVYSWEHWLWNPKGLSSKVSLTTYLTIWVWENYVTLLNLSFLKLKIVKILYLPHKIFGRA